MKRPLMFAGLGCVLLLGLPVSAGLAERAVAVEAGTTGLVRVPFEARNRTGRPLACAATLAHWYAAPIGEARPNEAVTGDLWSDPADGTVYLLNARSERMPVQSLWCGRAGGSASTRSDVWLERRRGVAEPAVRLVCEEGEAGATRPECRRDGGR